MKHSAIERAVAQTTGESRRTIRRYGFSRVVEEPQPSVTEVYLGLDCPGCGAEIALPMRGSTLPELAECRRCDGAYPYKASELYLAETRNAPVTVFA